MTAINRQFTFGNPRRIKKMPAVPRTRWVHVLPDGTEQNFLVEPSDVPTIFVQVEEENFSYVDESTRTYFNNGEPAPPPGRGWIQGQRSRSGHRWYRRRWL